MENTDREQLIALVKKEACNLKKLATKEELNKLILEDLNPTSPFKCIYGLMTDDCFSDRATELITLCATKVYKTKKQDFSRCTLNGSPKEYSREDRRLWENKYWSPIELFIYRERKSKSKTNMKILVDFLKDETKTLKF